MSGFYDQLCNMLIRPARQTYSDYDLGPPALGSLALRTNFTFESVQKHQIKASFYKQRNPVSDACVMYLHSFNGSRLEPLSYIPEIVKRGFHFCSLDFAGCGNSQGDYVSLGFHERWDALRMLREVRQRWGVKQIIVWGRSMGAVTAVKLYSLLQQEQSVGRLNDIKIMGLVLDSAFISLKRMVVEVGQNRMNIPEFLIKAIFLMIGSSIQQKANFRMQQVQLESDLEKVRCPVMLIASKQDTFVSYTHSQQMFAKLPLHEHKHLQYTGGQHYEQRNSQVINTIMKFIEQKYKVFGQTSSRQARVSTGIRPQTLYERPKSLRKYQPKRQQQIAQEQKIQKPYSGQKSQLLNINEEKCQQFATVGSEKHLPIPDDNIKQYKTQKKIEAPHITFTIKQRQVKAKDGLRSKSKPTFAGKAMQIVSRIKDEEVRRSGSNEPTQRQEKQTVHLNVISGKLKKKCKFEKSQFQSIRQDQHVNTIRFENKPNITSIVIKQENARPKKLSMTAQQYKNSQISILKGIVHLSPSARRKTVKPKTFQQSKSMSNLNGSAQTQPPIHLRTSSKMNLIQNMRECCVPMMKE